MEKFLENEQPKDFEIKKAEFFSNLAIRHLPEMRLLFRGGKLWKHDRWRNVAEHCLMETAAVETLCDLLGIKAEDKVKLMKVAACHDWAKRIDKNPQDFTNEERKKIKKFLQEAQPDAEQMKALDFEFLPEWFKGKWTLLQEVQLYVDDICLENNLVPFNKRIDISEQRDQDANNNPVLTSMLGGKYFEKEREFGRVVGEKLMKMLKEKNISMESSDQISQIIEGKIREKILEIK